MKTFQEVFGREPEVAASAPGRVNLLGEHTDYNDGYVLPIAIPQRTTVQLAANGGEWHDVYAADLNQRCRFKLDIPPAAAFAKYLYGCLRELSEAGYASPPMDMHASSAVPIGVGLSSSAALEIATLRALRALLGADLDDVRMALLAQRAEVRHAGVNCGIMDQMAASLADTDRMLFLDTRTLERKLLPLPEGAEILVIHSGVARSLAASGYNERRAECESAARRLGVRALRDVADLDLLRALPEPLCRRARHVVTENQRVLAAAAGLDAASFGALMNDSHRSLRDDFEVSVAALDRLAALLQEEPAVFGARLTGAGFGGACVALCEQRRARSTARGALARFNEGQRNGQLLVPAERQGGESE
jgi:galactokinase